MVGYMQGSKRARNTPSIANKTSIFGIMGGLAPRTGTSNVSVYRHQQIKGSRGLPQLYGKPIDYQKTYLKTNKLLSVNPLGSGGVGKKTSMFHQSCNCSQNIPMSGLLGINSGGIVGRNKVHAQQSVGCTGGLFACGGHPEGVTEDEPDYRFPWEVGATEESFGEERPNHGFVDMGLMSTEDDPIPVFRSDN